MLHPCGVKRNLLLVNPETRFREAGRLGVDDGHAVCTYTHIMKSRDVIAALEAAGWHEVARRGSHAQFKHPTLPGRVTVPHPERDIPLGTLRSIEKQSGVKLRR